MDCVTRTSMLLAPEQAYLDYSATTSWARTALNIEEQMGMNITQVLAKMIGMEKAIEVTTPDKPRFVLFGTSFLRYYGEDARMWTTCAATVSPPVIVTETTASVDITDVVVAASPGVLHPFTQPLRVWVSFKLLHGGPEVSIEAFFAGSLRDHVVPFVALPFTTVATSRVYADGVYSGTMEVELDLASAFALPSILTDMTLRVQVQAMSPHQAPVEVFAYTTDEQTVVPVAITYPGDVDIAISSDASDTCTVHDELELTLRCKKCVEYRVVATGTSFSAGASAVSRSTHTAGIVTAPPPAVSLPTNATSVPASFVLSAPSGATGIAVVLDDAGEVLLPNTNGVVAYQVDVGAGHHELRVKGVMGQRRDPVWHVSSWVVDDACPRVANVAVFFTGTRWVMVLAYMDGASYSLRVYWLLCGISERWCDACTIAHVVAHTSGYVFVCVLLCCVVFLFVCLRQA